MHNKDNLIPISGVVYASRSSYYDKKTQPHIRRKGYLIALASDYLIKHLNLTTDILVVLKKIPHDKNFKTFGQTFENGLIEIHIPTTKEKTLRVLCHEFVHAAQFESKTLSCGEELKLSWKGKIYHNSEPKSCGFQEYLNLPWEKEADKKEKILYARVRKHLKKIINDKILI